MTEVNLLPPEFRRRQRSRSVTRQIVLAFGAIVLLLLVVFFFERQQLSSAKGDLAAQNAQNASLQSRIDELHRFADLEAQLSTLKGLVTDLEQARVLWSSTLHDLSMVMPSDVYFTSLAGSITIGPGGWETSVGANGTIGGLQFQGFSLDYPNVALWLDRMVNVTGWENAWVSSASKNQPVPGGVSQEGVQFSGTVDLAPAAAEDGTAP
jgi:Tfp pilus assembly protein PilN